MSEVKLHRALGFWEAFATGIGLVVAATTLTSLGNGFGLGGPAFVIPAFVALVVSILIAFSYAELSSLLPGSGMIGDYTAPAIGRLAAIFGVLGGYIVLVATVDGAEVLVAGLAMSELLPAIPAVGFALLLTTLFLVVNLLGVEAFGKVQMIVTGVMILTLLAFAFMGLFEIGGGTRVGDVTFNPDGWGNLSQLVAIGIFLFIGIEFVCPMSEEVRNPERTIPRAMISGLVVIFVVDMLFGWTALLYADRQEMATSATPHLLAAEGIAGRAGLAAITVATVFASASTINSTLAAVPRMLYGLAREGLLPGIFAYLHPRFRTPWVSIFAVFALIIVPLLTFANSASVLTLILVAVITWLVSYILAQVDVIVLRRRYPNARRGFKTPLYPVPQVVGIAACVYMIVTIHPDPATRTTIWSGAAGMALIMVLYAVIWLRLVKKLPLFKPVPLEQELETIRQRTEGTPEEARDRTVDAEPKR